MKWSELDITEQRIHQFRHVASQVRWTLEGHDNPERVQDARWFIDDAANRGDFDADIAKAFHGLVDQIVAHEKRVGRKKTRYADFIEYGHPYYWEQHRVTNVPSDVAA